MKKEYGSIEDRMSVLLLLLLLLLLQDKWKGR